MKHLICSTYSQMDPLAAMGATVVVVEHGTLLLN
jgi:hypothetical protein